MLGLALLHRDIFPEGIRALERVRLLQSVYIIWESEIKVFNRELDRIGEWDFTVIDLCECVYFMNMQRSNEIARDLTMHLIFNR